MLETAVLAVSKGTDLRNRKNFAVPPRRRRTAASLAPAAAAPPASAPLPLRPLARDSPVRPPAPLHTDTQHTPSAPLYRLKKNKIIIIIISTDYTPLLVAHAR